MSGRLVVFAPNWLGDAVMALPAMEGVSRTSGEPVDVAARPAIAPLFTLVPWAARIVPLERGDKAADALRAGKYDVALLLPNSFHAARLARRAGIAQRWGYRADFRSLLLTRAIAQPPRLHHVEYYRHLVRAFGFEDGSAAPRLALTDTRRAAGATRLSHHGWTAGTALVALAPGAAYGGAKRWPAASFASLADHLHAAGVQVLLIGSAADRGAGDEVVAAMQPGVRLIDLIGQTDLPGLAAVLAHCRALVTNDSGAMHVAAALDVPVVAMFGPTIDRETRPLGRAPASVLTNPVWCRPCMLRECPLTHACLTGIGPDRVLAATQALL